MSYESVDKLQKVLAEEVFHYAKDKKKAAGRALGTLVEVITFYLLKEWDLEKYIAIERPLPEYSNDEINHNVEYSLHPSQLVCDIKFSPKDLPITVKKIANVLEMAGKLIASEKKKTLQLLSSDLVLRNACTIANVNNSFLKATLRSFTKKEVNVRVNQLIQRPFAIAECKRVGVEEGMRKGPQTIEKAKQGAYVARTVSALQRIRFPTGEIGGVFVRSNGKILCKRYDDFIQEIIASSDPELLCNFILTIGIVSNHGNWFTSNNHNKELKVLAQSYDWLLFLTDRGLAEFINDFILNPQTDYQPVRDAFLASYSGKSGSNHFTKVRIHYLADQLLQRYFRINRAKIESWFNIITPEEKKLELLRGELCLLATKKWKEIHS